LPAPATTHEHPVRRAKRPWRQFALPAMLRLPFRIDTRSGHGKALLSIRRGLVAQLGGDLTRVLGSAGSLISAGLIGTA
jgi:hypothetical protein